TRYRNSKSYDHVPIVILSGPPDYSELRCIDHFSKGTSTLAQGIYITTTTARAGKTLVSMGLADALNRRTGRVGYFRPIVAGDAVDADPMVQLMREKFGIGAEDAAGGGCGGGGSHGAAVA